MLSISRDSMVVNRPKLTSAIGAFVGSLLLLIGIFVLCNRVRFLSHASSSSAPIVAVTRELVPRGKGSVLAYVPTVRVIDSQGKQIQLKVDTFSEAPAYTVGQQLLVMCNPERGCIENTFVAKWGSALFDISLSIVFFLPLLFYRLGYWLPHGKFTGLNLQAGPKSPAS